MQERIKRWTRELMMIPGLSGFEGTVRRYIRAELKEMGIEVKRDIPGIGQNRKKSLLAVFGSIEGIKNADVSELAAAEGMNRKAAEEVRLFFERRARMTEQPKAADAGGDKRKTAD